MFMLVKGFIFIEDKREKIVNEFWDISNEKKQKEVIYY